MKSSKDTSDSFEIRALRLFAYAFFFSFPVVFAGVPVFFGGGLPHWISLYEGVRIAWICLAAFVFALSWTVSARFFVPALAVAGVLAAVHGYDFFSVTRGDAYSVVPLFAVATAAAAYASFSPEDRLDFRRAAVFWFVFANLPYALAQRFGYDPVTVLAVLPDWGEGRAFWTLWNPNALAFFAAMCLPTAFLKTKYRALLVVSLLFVAFLSGSASGAALAFCYAAVRTIRLGKFRWAAALLQIAVATVWLVPEKWFSIQTRAAISADVLSRLVSSPSAFFSWEGPQAVSKLFSSVRSAELNKFVDSGVPIDRAHSFFLDTAAVYGIPLAVAAVSFFIIRAFWKTETESRDALSVFLLLWLLHTPLSAHLLFAGMFSALPARKIPPASSLRKE